MHSWHASTGRQRGQKHRNVDHQSRHDKRRPCGHKQNRIVQRTTKQYPTLAGSARAVHEMPRRQTVVGLGIGRYGTAFWRPWLPSGGLDIKKSANSCTKMVVRMVKRFLPWRTGVRGLAMQLSMLPATPEHRYKATNFFVPIALSTCPHKYTYAHPQKAWETRGPVWEMQDKLQEKPKWNTLPPMAWYLGGFSNCWCNRRSSAYSWHVYSKPFCGQLFVVEVMVRSGLHRWREGGPACVTASCCTMNIDRDLHTISPTLCDFPHRATYAEEAQAVAQNVRPASVERHRGDEAVPLSVVGDGVRRYARRLYIGYCGRGKLRKKSIFANTPSNFPHVRSLWEKKVASKVCKRLCLTVIVRNGANLCKRLTATTVREKVPWRDFSHSTPGPASTPHHKLTLSCHTHARDPRGGWRIDSEYLSDESEYLRWSQRCRTCEVYVNYSCWAPTWLRLPSFDWRAKR